MTPIRQKKIRTLLRAAPSGLSALEIGRALDLHPANVRTSLKAMPDVYVDRWRMGGRGQFATGGVAVPVPDD